VAEIILPDGRNLNQRLWAPASRGGIDNSRSAIASRRTWRGKARPTSRARSDSHHPTGLVPRAQAKRLHIEEIAPRTLYRYIRDMGLDGCSPALHVMLHWRTQASRMSSQSRCSAATFVGAGQEDITVLRRTLSWFGALRLTAAPIHRWQLEPPFENAGMQAIFDWSPHPKRISVTEH
jgi:hypothetical protein